ncbi:MAG: MSHA biogenesis protein MshI [Burkholderiales bacterium]
MSQQINLFNPIFLRQEKYFSAKTMIESLTLILIALCAFYVYARNQVGSLESVAIESTRQLDNTRDSFIKLGGEFSPERRSKLLEARVARAEAEVRGKEALLASLNATAAGRAPAYSEYLAAFARHALPGVWLTGFSVDGGGEELSIRGRVLHPDLVPAYIHALNSEAVMRGRSVSRLKLVAHRESPAAGTAQPSAGPSRYVEFDLSMPLSAPRANAEAAPK